MSFHIPTVWVLQYFHLILSRHVTEETRAVSAGTCHGVCYGPRGTEVCIHCGQSYPEPTATFSSYPHGGELCACPLGYMS